VTLDEVREKLTARQIAVLKLAGDGLRQEQIADRLCISHKTVHTHLTQIRARLKVATTTAAAVLATKAGLL
jgi:DNA-binding NarL/FixJ family response regulator